MSVKLDGHPPNPPSSSPVRIEKLVPGGAGLGFINGDALFVPLSAPGDLVTLRDVRRRRGVWFAELDRVVEKGPGRQKAPCPWFGLCGGCQWMHMEYGSQMRGKEDILRQVLKHIAGIKKFPDVSVHPSPSKYNYRFRARLQIHGSVAGFYQRSSNRIVRWKDCLLLPSTINEAVGEFRAWLEGGAAVPGLTGCELAMSPVDGEMTFNWILSGDRVDRALMSRIAEETERIMALKGITVTGQTVHCSRGRAVTVKSGCLNLRIDDVNLSASPGTFFQVNPGINDLLVKKVLGYLRSSGAASLLDLYCGNGNFSLPAAAAGLATVGVEASRISVENARSSSGPESSFVRMDVGRFLAQDRETRDAVIVDPPRTGLPRDVTRSLMKRPFPILLYISCEPPTLARDLAHLTRAGYVIENLELFDMFPHTSHAEVLVVMKGKTARTHGTA